MNHTRQIKVTDKRIYVRLSASTLELPSRQLPEVLVKWLQEGRLAVYRQLLNDPEKVDFFQQHLPVLVTSSSGSSFPFNCGNKGVGFLPREKFLDKYIGLYRETIEATKAVPWQRSLEARIKAARTFHEDHEAIDYRCLTSIEIFQKQTFRNLQNYPLASLLFTGASPSYMSFQLNCAVEIIGEHDPRFTFIKLSRRMFEFDSFHIAQPDFQTGYLFWISEVMDKTPHRVAHSNFAKHVMPQQPVVPWDDEAMSILQTIPAWSRSHVKSQVEHYCAERGFNRITAEILTEARNILRH